VLKMKSIELDFDRDGFEEYIEEMKIRIGDLL